MFAKVAPRFALWRQQLNALSLSRRPPKRKAAWSKSTVEVAPLSSEFLGGNGAGKKAGVLFYSFHVGAAEHLYNTQHPAIPGEKTLSVDPHGLTREEAWAQLDAALSGWVDTAIRGAYSWVVLAVIVCGKGGQILAETVEGWIREHDSVARAPRRCSRRRPT